VNDRPSVPPDARKWLPAAAAAGLLAVVVVAGVALGGGDGDGGGSSDDAVEPADTVALDVGTVATVEPTKTVETAVPVTKTQLTRVLAKQLAPQHVTVNAIAPGPFESKMMASTLEAMGDQIAQSAPLQRIGRPDDVAGTAIYLSSRAGSYLTGTVIPVDGGIATTK